MDKSDAAGVRVDKDVQAASPSMERGARPAEASLAELVQRIAMGDADALSKLYDETSEVVYSLALRVLRSDADAEEVALEAYTRVWRRAADYDAKRGGVLAWLTMMTRSMSIDRLRSNEARGAGHRVEWSELHSPVSREAGAEESAILGQRRARVRAALERLPAEQREVLELAYFGGMSQSEMAERLGLPLGTVKTRARLGLARLAEFLEGVE